MKLKALLIAALACLGSHVGAQTIAVNGVDDNGSGGVYDINGQNYWWLCIEPGTPQTGGAFLAQSAMFAEGWDQQNQERLNFFQSNPSLYSTVIPRQVAVMSYVLDTYLPWNTLAGASGRFAEQSSSSANYGNNDPFYNALFVVQNFLAETYGKTVLEDFTDLSSYVNYFAADMTAAGMARSSLFQLILDDVENLDQLDPTFFDTYQAQHGYSIVNTLYNQADPNNWQDALIIASFAPVPEPGGALLLGCGGLAWALRRRRRA